MRSSTIRLLPLAAVAALCACTRVFLQPDRYVYAQPWMVGAKWTPAEFRAADGTKLYGMWFPARTAPAKGVLVQFHGNGANVTAHFMTVYWLALEGWDVLAFDYRGYGGSDGKKSLSGAVMDGRAALAFARKKAPGLPLVVLGQSLGGAVALASLDEDGGKDLRALVLDSTFASYRRIAREKLDGVWWARPFRWPLSFLVSDRYEPLRLVARRRRVPLLMMAAKGDPVVPYSEGRSLYAAAPGPKEWWDVPGTGHAEALGSEGGTFRPRLKAWLDEALLK
jgi:fermentation-respiration switch protein FrsA (DUF1100 family)